MKKFIFLTFIFFAKIVVAEGYDVFGIGLYDVKFDGRLSKNAVWWSPAPWSLVSTVKSPPDFLARLRAMNRPSPELDFSSRLTTSGVHPRSNRCCRYRRPSGR